MRIIISRILVLAMLTVIASVQAETKPRSKSIVIVSPADLPELAQRRSEAMYLYSTRIGQTFLYLEQDQGRTLAILDVTDLAAIREVGRASLAAKSPYDFVQNLGGSATLIRYRDRSGFAIINLRKYKQPILIPAPELLNPATVQPVGHRALLLTSVNSPANPAQDCQYEVIDISNPSKPTSLAIVHEVRQRLERPDTGTLFLLGNDGLTVIRRPNIEDEYQSEMTYTN
jgi:hypothetical protein